MYEKELMEMRNMFKDTDLIIVADKEGKLMYYNNFNDIHNRFGNQDHIGKSIFELYPWLTRENSTIFKVIDSGEPIVNQLQNIRVGKNYVVTAFNSAFPLKNESGIIGAIEISTSLPNKRTNKKNDKSKYLNFSAKYSFEDIITNNPEMKEIIMSLKGAARGQSNIFIYGETGTGKEIMAHAVHNHSNRWNKPFIAQNCAAIPSTLIESILFGSTKGSFTGAEDKQGLFEMANGGTVYLDEINSMPLDMQAKLLRVLEDKRIRRVGDNREINVDVRIIASTNEKPEKLLEGNGFRRDLFYRLNVVSIEIPPLRERIDDIKVLCEHFMHSFNNVFGKRILGIENNVMHIFMEYKWPGNVRELRNCMESAYNLVNGSYININHIPRYIADTVINRNSQSTTFEKKLTVMLDEYEKEIIEKALGQKKYNVSKTARMLGIPRQTLYYKLKKYNLLSD